MNSIFKKITFFTALILCFSSCSKYLEETPQNKLKPSNTDDYAQLLNNAYITEQIMPYIDILTDDVSLIASDHVMDGTDYGDEMVGAYMWDDTHESTMPKGDIAFQSLYESIFYTNVVIENIDNARGVVLDENAVQKAKNNIKGEALALRAYSYFYLVNLYAEPYDPETADDTPGVPVTLETGAAAKDYVRNSVGDVYRQIEKDLLDGIKLMEENEIEKTKFQFDSFRAKAFLSRVYLYMKNYDDAIEYAEYIVDHNPAIYNLYDAGEKLSIANNIGTSWVTSSKFLGAYKNYLSIDNSNILFVNGLSELFPALGYWPFTTTFSVNLEFANIYEENDVRRFAFLYTYQRNTYSGFRSKLVVAKTVPSSTTVVLYANNLNSGQTRVLRTEEMLLILAESYARTNKLPESVNYLNLLREQKFKMGTYIPLSASNFTQASLIDFVMLERRKELCFEGQRWFDLRRTTRPAMTRVGYDEKVASLAQDDPRYVLQIPERELKINPKIEMNPR